MEPPKKLTFTRRPEALTRLLRGVSPRECHEPAPVLLDGDPNLRRFAFRQHDPDLKDAAN